MFLAVKSQNSPTARRRSSKSRPAVNRKRKKKHFSQLPRRESSPAYCAMENKSGQCAECESIENRTLSLDHLSSRMTARTQVDFRRKSRVGRNTEDFMRIGRPKDYLDCAGDRGTRALARGHSISNVASRTHPPFMVFARRFFSSLERCQNCIMQQERNVTISTES